MNSGGRRMAPGPVLQGVPLYSEAFVGTGGPQGKVPRRLAESNSRNVYLTSVSYRNEPFGLD